MGSETLPSIVSAANDSEPSRIDDSDQYDPLLDVEHKRFLEQSENRVGSQARSRLSLLRRGLLLLSILFFIIGVINIAMLFFVKNATLKTGDEIAAVRMGLTATTLR